MGYCAKLPQRRENSITTGSMLSLNGSFSSKPTKPASQQTLQPTDAGKSSKVYTVVETDKDEDSRRPDKSAAAGSRPGDNRVALTGPPLGTKHRRNPSDGSDGSGEMHHYPYIRKNCTDGSLPMLRSRSQLIGRAHHTKKSQQDFNECSITATVLQLIA